MTDESNGGADGARSIRVNRLYIIKDGQDPRTINWQKDGYLGFEAWDGYDAWYGHLDLEARKDWPDDGVQEDLSKFEDLKRLLHAVPREDMYPEFPAADMTEYRRPPRQQQKPRDVHFKAPAAKNHKPGSNDLAARLLREAAVQEQLLRSPHPHIGSYLGCVVDEGRLVRIALRRYGTSLYHRILEMDGDRKSKDGGSSGNPVRPTLQDGLRWMEQIGAAAAHLHSLGLAHNDISPSNIMLTGPAPDEEGEGRKGEECAMLIDFDCCYPLGAKLDKGGWTTGWQGPPLGEGRQFKESSVLCDELAIQGVRDWLTVKLGEV